MSEGISVKDCSVPSHSLNWRTLLCFSQLKKKRVKDTGLSGCSMYLPVLTSRGQYGTSGNLLHTLTGAKVTAYIHEIFFPVFYTLGSDLFLSTLRHILSHSVIVSDRFLSPKTQPTNTFSTPLRFNHPPQASMKVSSFKGLHFLG